MKDFMNWSESTLFDVSDCGSNALFSFICDYQNATRDYGWMSINEFVKTWTAIRREDFRKLQKGDIVYDVNGNRWQCTEESYENTNELCLYVECVYLTDNNMIKTSLNGSNEIFSIGNLYFAPNYTRLAKYKHKNLEREERACPILITKIKQLQN